MKVGKHYLAILISGLFILLGTARAEVSGLGADAGLGEEPLMPDQAFVLSTEVIGADMIRARWHIVDGYYMYRNKFKFESNTQGVTPQPGIYPKGKVKKDEFFGEVETYRGDIAIDIPITRDSDIRKLDLTITSQGCADIGICYPPQKQNVSLELPPLVKTAAASEAAKSEDSFSALGSLKSLGKSLGLTDDDDGFLPPDEVFIFSAEVENGNAITASWEIKDGYYLYRDKFEFKLQDANGITIGNIVMPKGDEKVDEAFGRMIVYHDDININIPLNRTNLEPTNITLAVRYQGCSEKGFCYPPQDKTMPLSLPAGQAQAPVQAASSTGDDVELSEQDQISKILAESSIWAIIASFFGFGLVLAFTACMYPMIPILSSIIVGQGENITTAKAFTLSLVYVEAMALTFGLAGGITATLGAGVGVQAYFQSPWVLIPFAILFVALAMSMFGFYNIQLPASWQSRFSEISNQQKGGTLVGVAIMGVLSALIIGPCGGPVLVGALAYAAQSEDIFLGFISLFFLGNGMGAPLLFVGATGGKLLPRAGSWMDTVKYTAGVILLAIAILMLERVSFIGSMLTMSLWASLFIISAVYMGALTPLNQDAAGWSKFWKGLGLVIMLYGIMVFLSGLTGGKDVTNPQHGSTLFSASAVSASGAAGAAAHSGVEFKRIKSVEDLQREIAAANKMGKPVMLDFYADWCTYCIKYEEYVFTDPQVKQTLSKLVLLQADVTATDEQDKALLKHVGVMLPPTIMFFDTSGKELRQYRIVGDMNAEQFNAHVSKALQALKL